MDVIGPSTPLSLHPPGVRIDEGEESSTPNVIGGRGLKTLSPVWCRHFRCLRRPGVALTLFVHMHILFRKGIRQPEATNEVASSGSGPGGSTTGRQGTRSEKKDENPTTRFFHRLGLIHLPCPIRDHALYRPQRKGGMLGRLGGIRPHFAAACFSSLVR